MEKTKEYMKYKDVSINVGDRIFITDVKGTHKSVEVWVVKVRSDEYYDIRFLTTGWTSTISRDCIDWDKTLKLREEENNVELAKFKANMFIHSWVFIKEGVEENDKQDTGPVYLSNIVKLRTKNIFEATGKQGFTEYNLNMVDTNETKEICNVFDKCLTPGKTVWLSQDAYNTPCFSLATVLRIMPTNVVYVHYNDADVYAYVPISQIDWSKNKEEIESAINNLNVGDPIFVIPDAYGYEAAGKAKVLEITDKLIDIEYVATGEYNSVSYNSVDWIRTKEYYDEHRKSIKSFAFGDTIYINHNGNKHKVSILAVLSDDMLEVGYIGDYSIIINISQIDWKKTLEYREKEGENNMENKNLGLYKKFIENGKEYRLIVDKGGKIYIKNSIIYSHPSESLISKCGNIVEFKGITPSGTIDVQFANGKSDIANLDSIDWIKTKEYYDEGKGDGKVKFIEYSDDMFNFKKTKDKKTKECFGLIYDGVTLRDPKDKSIKVTRDIDIDLEEDLEKAVMMYLLKKEGYTFSDVEKIMKHTEIVWKPSMGEMYYTVYNLNNSQRRIASKCYNNDCEDNFNLSNGNYFKTYDEAIEAFERVIKALRG